MILRFSYFVLCLAFSATEVAAESQPKPNCDVADQMTTGAIDIAADAIKTKLSRVPATGTIEIAFAPYPQRSAERLVKKIIYMAKTSVVIAAYQMTSKPIADALCNAAARGVAVTAVLDNKSNPHSKGYSKRDYLSDCGVYVRTTSRYPIMHDKFIVVDSAHVETGSFNYSFAAAERNAENAIVMWNNPLMAAQYQNEFERLFNEAKE
jgi:phosphatidylserine/phosphatidylglycerophosphate/cardiolipin synthase-like enzyme